MDPGKGHGHHKHVRTAGKQSKFGISASDIPKVVDLVEKTGAKVVGLHAHLGSGIYTVEAWRDTARYLANLKDTVFPHVRTLDLGGGLGVPEKEEQEILDLNEVNKLLVQLKEQFQKKLQIWIEPGRYLVALAGVLLVKVTQRKNKEGNNFVGVNTGFNSLIRPMLYGAYHEIFNLSRIDDPLTMTTEIVGIICESGDVFGHNRRLPDTKENDILLIAVTGAYGHSMSSNYNLRDPAQEILI